MAIIQPINPNDRLRESREIINNNFNSLNTAKANRTEIQGSALTFATTTGTGNNFAVALMPAPVAYTTGLTINFRANRNNTGATTLNVNGLGARTIRKNGTENLIAGDIIQGAVYTVIFDGDFFQIVGGASAENVRTFGNQVIFGDKDFRGNVTGVEMRNFTYGETIAVNDAVYLRASDGMVMRTNASFDDERTHNFIGFAKEAGNLNDVKRVQIDGVVEGFTGLTQGREYFLSNTPGQISLLPGSNPLRIAFSISANNIFIQQAVVPLELDFWQTMAPAPAAVDSGGGLIRTHGDHIFALQGGGTAAFWRYSISGNSWATMAPAPDTIFGFNNAFGWTGGDHIFALRGNTTNTFWRYSISGNSWATMAPAPDVSRDNGSLAWTGGDHIFALRGADSLGNFTNTFWRYSISGNSWATMAPAPTVVSFGNALIYTHGDHIFAFSGSFSHAFWRYSISANSWTIIASPGFSIAGGSSLTWDGGDHIFALRGNTTNTFWRYSISGNSWATMAPAPTVVGLGGSLAWTRIRGTRKIFALRGNNTTDFWRYNI